MKKIFVLIGALLLVAMVLAACGGEGETVEVTVEVTRIVEVPAEGGAAEAGEVTFEGGGDTLATVQDRGILNCGGHATLPGFGYLEADGTYNGFDYDFCRVVAAAVYGEGGADNVEIRPTTGTDRFPVLQSGEVDVLIRNTTWTISRDTSLGFDFQPTTFYDGQGMMVREDSGLTTLEDFEGGSVCVQAGTTTEKNLADVFRGLGITYESIVCPDNNACNQAYDEGRCDGLTTDKSGLAASRTQLTNPDDHIILDATMSKEPLAPLTRHGDNNWGDVVMWAVNCTIQAEELDITSENVDEFLGSDDPVVLNLLGVEGDLGQALGLDNDFCYQVIKQVGNYEQIYNRNLGPDTAVYIPRGYNSLYTEGGLLYSPPFR